MVDECSEYHNKADCVNNECYWYNASCHNTPPSTCEELFYQFDCEAYSCYWYYGCTGYGCHSSLPPCYQWASQAECENNGCYWYDSCCHDTPQPTEICVWIADHGGALNISLMEVFQMIDSYIYQIPPSGYSFIPSITATMSIIDYYLGFDGGLNCYSTLIIRPNNTGDHTGIFYVWPTGSPHWSVLAEATLNCVDAVGCEIGTNDTYDLYHCADHTTQSGTITNLVVYAYVRAGGDANSWHWIKIKTGGAEYQSDTFVSPANPGGYTAYAWPMNPKTGQPWTWTDIDNLQIGIRLYNESGTHTIHCCQIYAIIYYQP